MSKKVIWIIVILTIIVIIFAKGLSKNNSQEEFKPIDKNIGDEFTELTYPNKMYIINYEVADVTGDGEKDMILLIGECDLSTGLANCMVNNMDIVVYNTAEKKFVKGNCKVSGMNNKLAAYDFTGSETLDIVLITENENGKCIRIYKYESDNLKEIWKERNNKGLVFIGEFVDGFKIDLVNKKLNLNKKIDMSSQKEVYIENGIYDASGRLMNNSKILTSGFVSIDIVELNDRAGISTLQRICGANENDIIDEIKVIWKYVDGKWQMVEAKGYKLGNLLY